jgi:hypothetical protein
MIPEREKNEPSRLEEGSLLEDKELLFGFANKHFSS